MKYTLFDTAIGACGIGWSDLGVVRFQLPEATKAATRLRLKGLTEEPKPPAWVKKAIRTISLHLEGNVQDLQAIKLDLTSATPFNAEVYAIARAIPPGKTMTYGEIATRAGKPGASRAVGRSMGTNPLAILVPCHRVLAAGGAAGGFSAYGGTVTKAKILAAEGFAPAPKPAASGSLFDGARQLPFDADEAVRHLATKDKRLARLIESVGPFAMKLEDLHGEGGAFAALAQSIVYQQLTGKAAATILGRVKSLLVKKPGQTSFFTPKALLAATDADLRVAGLSGSKVKALRDLAEKAEAGLLPTYAELEKMDGDEIIERLTTIRGIGRWTVEMLLMFRLGRPDILPVGDYGVRKGFARIYKMKELPTPAELTKRAEKWRPYRTVASWYMWRALEQE